MRLLLGALLLGCIAGCANQAVKPASPAPAPAITDQRRIQVLGDALQMCMDGVKQMTALCPHVPQNTPFEQGIQACIKEVNAQERPKPSNK